jgi:glycosyltransferase involved in cell wall biosynthesis
MSDKVPTRHSTSGDDRARQYSYVLITPARNEAAFLEKVINSVVGQTIRPIKWVIVSDGSTDGTDSIVERYAAKHGWIELLRMPERQERHFAGKAHAFNAGYAKVEGLDYDIIGNLDADVSFDSDYFAFLLSRLSENPRLGLVGTPFDEGGESYDYRFVSIEHVSGACQLFRRECFEMIGGYVPMQGGGIDHLAVVTARMKGWQTRTYPEKVCHHHRKQGSASNAALKSKFRVGTLDYALGGHPVWELFRAVYQMTKRPFIVGGCMIFTGYFWSMVRRVERPVSLELVKFRRREQIARLKRFLRRSARRSRQTSPQEPT